MSTEPSSATARSTAASTCGAVGHVAADGDRPPPHAADLLDRLLRVHEALLPRDGRERAVAVGLLGELRLDEQVGDDDVGARAGKRQRVGAPEPARAAGDERDAPGEIDLDAHRRRATC